MRFAGLDPERAYEIDPRFLRPTDVDSLCGDPSRIRALGWEPTLSFRELVRTMVEADLAELERDPLAAEPDRVA